MEDFTENWSRRDVFEPDVKKEYWPPEKPLYFFAVDVPDEISRVVCSTTVDRLGDLDCIRVFPPNWLHVTLKRAGFSLEDDRVERLIEQAEEKLENVSSFKVELKRLNLFPSAVFVEVHGSGELRRLNSRLSDLEGVAKDEYRYTPHVSIANFRSENQFGELIKELEMLRDRKFGSFEVDQVKLLKDKMDGDMGFEVVEVFDL